MRPLGISTVKDRVVQQGVKLLLEPIFEADFHENSSRAFAKMQNYVEEEMRRWLWKKNNKKHGRYSHYGNDRLYQHYGLFKLPLYAAWKYS